MQRCPNCGTEISSEHCYNCGWQPGYPTGQEVQNGINNNYQPQPQVNYKPNFEESQQQNSYQNTYNQSYGYEMQTDDGFLGNNRLSQKNGTSATVKAVDWFKFYGITWLLCLVPFVGTIASLVYQIIMLCRKDTAPSIRGFLKFQLIFSVVAMIILIIIFTIVGLSFGSALSEIEASNFGSATFAA